MTSGAVLDGVSAWMGVFDKEGWGVERWRHWMEWRWAWVREGVRTGWTADRTSWCGYVGGCADMCGYVGGCADSIETHTREKRVLVVGVRATPYLKCLPIYSK